jgi:uncharacterized protein YqgC (DUF456 family)
MEWLFFSLSVLFALFGVVCLLLVVAGLPGTWLLLGVAVVIELLDGPVLGRGGPGAVTTFGRNLLLVSAVVAATGEAIEFVSKAAGARLGGSTRRGMWGALAGGLLGAILATGAIPIPLLGTILGAIAGTFLGAWIGETTGIEARSREQTLRAALAAVLGHLGGMLAKLAAGAVVWALLVRALF